MEALIPKIISWAEERNIVKGSNVERETLKLVYKCGKLTKFVDNKDICDDGVGQCIIQMIIICRMFNITLDDCLKFTKIIKDARVLDPQISSIMVFNTIGELAEKIITRKEIKAEIGYLLIYLTTLTNSLQLSIKECTELAFKDIQNVKGIMFDGKLVDEGDEQYEVAKTVIANRNP